jgi:hypothetical protein
MLQDFPLVQLVVFLVTGFQTAFIVLHPGFVRDRFEPSIAAGPISHTPADPDPPPEPTLQPACAAHDCQGALEKVASLSEELRILERTCAGVVFVILCALLLCAIFKLYKSIPVVVRELQPEGLHAAEVATTTVLTPAAKRALRQPPSF